jgi:hypothetical protein
MASVSAAIPDETDEYEMEPKLEKEPHSAG